VSGEQAIVVEHRKELTYLLCQAAELEHSLMAQYLFAAFSLRAPPEPMAPGELQPRGQDFSTQGQLYRAIEDGLARLAQTMGEERLLIGPHFHQTDAPHIWPELVPITDAAGARRTIERIVEKGEGARGDWATAHYGRFLAVLEEYRAMREEDPSFDPAHPAVAAGVRGVEGIDPDVFISDPVTAAVSDVFNAVYDVLLQMIARYFAFGHETAHATDAIQADQIEPV
jgi:hypothetical protein